MHLKCDVLLADVFEKFKNSSLKNYELCPSHYLSTPALSWNALLNRAKVELELITDPDMHVHILGKRYERVMFLIFLIDIIKPTISI